FAGAVEAAQPSEITATTVLEAMSAADGIDLLDLAPPYSTQTPGTAPLISLYNGTYWPAVVQDGVIVSINGKPALGL
ncbi:MAG: hypothetical protein Q8K63_05910, partial [Acidimicrobiales bacterium]|nr:hypothetical protein [Acidimicrobiales bacterium]